MFSRTLFSRLPKPFSCRAIAPLLTKYVEAASTLTANERVAVDAHLHVCPACREETEAVRAMGSFLRAHGPAALPAHVPAPDLWERIEGKLVTETQESRRRSGSLRPVLLFAPALAAIIVAVVLLPKQPTPQNSPSGSVALVSGTLAADRSAESAKKSTEMVAMAEAGTSRLSFAAAPMATPAAKRMRSDETKSVRRTRLGDSANRATESYAFRRTESADFDGKSNVSLKPRDKGKIRLVAQNSSQPRPPLGEITIIDVVATPAPTKVASAWRGGAAPEPRPVVPAAGVNERYFATTEPKTITVVESDPGNGVSVAASYAAPPVTDTMIRQRQRRGLFGGYGAGGAAIAVLPASSGAVSGSETGTP